MTSPEIQDVIASGSVVSQFEPVVDLDSGTVVGYEALSRGPAGELHEPAALFAAARERSLLTELDWACRMGAVQAARSAGLRFPVSLLINAEPETLLADRGDTARWAQFADLRCYAEITERAIARTPGKLAAAIDQIRAQDWGIALDDVGANPASLTLLPLLQPDLIKLDLSVLHRDPASVQDASRAEIVDAVLCQAADSGAAVIVEGIETERHLELARAWGAQYGQGYLFGHAGPLPDKLPVVRTAMPLVPRLLDRAVDPGPFAVLASAGPTRTLSEDSVLELGRHLLAHAMTLHPAPAVLLCSARPWYNPVAEALNALTATTEANDTLPLLGLVGAPQPGFAVTELAQSDPAARDFAVAVVSAHFAGAVVARASMADDGTYDAALTLRRDTARAVANSILTRL